MRFGGRETPSRFPSQEIGPPRTPVQAPVFLPLSDSRKVTGYADSKQALYQLLGQDLDIYVEAHAVAYEQMRKKWTECSIDEWKKGADGTLPAR